MSDNNPSQILQDRFGRIIQRSDNEVSECSLMTYTVGGITLTCANDIDAINTLNAMAPAGWDPENSQESPN